MAVLKDLIVHGPSRFIGASYIDTLEANSVKANEGLFTKLAAKSASANELTVSGLLDVHGELHTKSWSNSNIATVDGNLHIVPTITAASVTGTITYSSGAYSMDLTGAFATNTLTIGNSATVVAWTPGSKLIVSGEVKIGNEWLPLGTLKCDLGGSSNLAIDAASKKISLTSIKDANSQTSGVLESIRSTLNLSGTSSSLSFRNVKIAFYSRKNTKMYPIGILLTAQGTGASKTFIDMYDGNHEASGTYGGLAMPVVRIGNLSGNSDVANNQPLPAVGGQTPTGWGIYTSNGYFSGVIAANKGYIGSYVIDGTYLQSSDKTTGMAIIDNATTADWAFWAGGTSTSAAKFRVTQDGILHATGADITGKIKVTSGSNVYTTDNVNPLEIGGRNLLVGTNHSVEKVTTATSSYVTQILYDTPDSVTLKSLGCKVNDEVTLSFDWEVTNATTYGNARIEWYGATSSSEMVYLAALINPFATFSSSNLSGHVKTTVKLTSTTINSKRLVLRIDNSNLTLTILNLKLEKGNKATDWTAAPEDNITALGELASDISGLSDEVSGMSQYGTDILNLQKQQDTQEESIKTQSNSIATLQTGQKSINNSITGISIDINKLAARTTTLERGVDIDPDEPSISIVQNSSMIKVMPERIVIKGTGNSVAWADSESFNAQKGVFTEIRPRTMVINGSTVTLQGNLAFMARTNGHVSLKRVVDTGGN